VNAAVGLQKPSAEPVWRLLLKHLLNQDDPEVAKLAAAALAQ
jgi:hypothetical protein